MKSNIEKTLKEDNQGIGEPIDDMLAKDLVRFPPLTDPTAKPYYWPTYPNAGRFFPCDTELFNIPKSNTEMPSLSQSGEQKLDSQTDLVL